MRVPVRRAMRSAPATDEKSVSRQSPNRELCPCTKSLSVRSKSLQSENTRSTSTGTTATAAGSIPGSSCGGNARVRSVENRRSAFGHEALLDGISLKKFMTGDASSLPLRQRTSTTSNGRTPTVESRLPYFSCSCAVHAKVTANSRKQAASFTNCGCGWELVT